MRKSVLLPAGDQADLGVALAVLRAVDDAAAGLLHLTRPADVVLLVEARAQLHHHDDLLAVLGGLAEVLGDGGVPRQAVDGDLDGQHVRVGGALPQQLQEGIDGLVGIEQEQVALLNLRAHGHFPIQILRPDRRIGRVVQLRRAVVQHVGVAQLQRARAAVHLLHLQLQKACQHLGQPRRIALQLQPHRREALTLAQQAGHVVQEVRVVLVKLFLVQADVRVAGDGDHRLLLDDVDLEDLLQVRGNHGLGAHEARRRARQHQDRRHRFGHVHDAQQHLAPIVQNRRRVEILVLEMREGMVAVDDLGREHRADVVAVVLVNVVALALGEGLVGDLRHALGG